MHKTENFYMQENSKNMHVSRLMNSSSLLMRRIIPLKLTDKGIDLMTDIY